MFHDDFDYFQGQIDKLLETYDIDELLEMSDMTDSEALTHLFINGLIQLPDMKPVSFDA